MRVLACVGLTLVALAAGCGRDGRTQRPDLQRVLDGIVAGPHRLAPGATAYVAGARGTWLGSAGRADVRGGVPMPTEARMRLESVSKLWTAVVVLKLVEDGRLRLGDTVERWLPGVFPDGDRITVRQLLEHTSGLIDSNDVVQNFAYWLAQVHDPALHARLVRVRAELVHNPAAQHSPMLEIRMAAAVPLQAEPGTAYHYSNIGYELAGVIAERAAGVPLRELYDRFIVRPLELESAAYAPGDRFDGRHPVGYVVRPGGELIAASAWGTGGLAAQGGIVANAQDEARFLVAVMQGKLLRGRLLRELKTARAATGFGYGLGTGVTSTCAGTAYTHNGGEVSWASSVAVTGDGSRVAVLLLNGRRTDDAGSDIAAVLQQLFCAA